MHSRTCFYCTDDRCSARGYQRLIEVLAEIESGSDIINQTTAASISFIMTALITCLVSYYLQQYKHNSN